MYLKTVVKESDRKVFRPTFIPLYLLIGLYSHDFGLKINSFPFTFQICVLINLVLSQVDKRKDRRDLKFLV